MKRNKRKSETIEKDNHFLINELFSWGVISITGVWQEIMPTERKKFKSIGKESYSLLDSNVSFLLT